MNIRLVREMIAQELGFRSWKRLINTLGNDKELIDWYNNASNIRYQKYLTDENPKHLR